MVLHPVIQERRKFPRGDVQPRVAVNLLQAHRSIAASSVNIGEGGLCLRVEETLEVRSLVRLHVTPEQAASMKGPRPFECMGRVAWVVQRLDLRAAPPFLFDVGIEFVDPSPTLRRLLAQRGARLTTPQVRVGQAKALDSAVIRGRRFMPRLEREANHALRWHLVVSVDGVPCFSGHYPSERVAMAAWATFRRQQAKRS